MNELDEKFMAIALEQARQALAIDEVPIGACIVNEEDELIAAAHNLTITNNDPTAHAEIITLRDAAQKLGNYRLTNLTLYTTIEPCVMCAGALVNARVKRLVFGSPDPRFGGVVTKFRICDSPDLNHRIEITGGVLQTECGDLLSEFFKKKRRSQKLAKENTSLT